MEDPETPRRQRCQGGATKSEHRTQKRAAGGTSAAQAPRPGREHVRGPSARCPAATAGRQLESRAWEREAAGRAEGQDRDAAGNQRCA